MSEEEPTNGTKTEQHAELMDFIMEQSMCLELRLEDFKMPCRAVPLRGAFFGPIRVMIRHD